MAFTLAVTGASGFVGGHVMAQAAARSGWQLRCLLRKPSRVALPANATAIEGDLFSEAALQKLCAGADVVLHIAGAVSGSAEAMHDVNARGTARLAAAARTAGVPRFVHVSSLAAREAALSPYAASKAAAEEALHRAYGAGPSLIIRPPAIYGEGDLATLPLLKALCARRAMLPGRADARFSLIHGADLAAILCDAVLSPVSGLREVDDGCGAYDWARVADITRRITGRPLALHFIPRSVAMAVGHGAGLWSAITGRPGMISPGKMRELYHAEWVARPPGWPRPKAITLEEGMRCTLIWAMDKGLLPRLPIADRSPAP